MPWEASLDNWFRSQDPLRTIHAYNRHESASHQKRQFGGTFLLSRGQSSSQVISMGIDPSQLGRWCWIQYKGNHDSSLFIYVVYRPVKQPRHALLSTYMQQSRYLESQQDRTCPRKALLRDLELELRARLSLGHRLIVAGDFNEPVHIGEIREFFTHLNMYDAILSRFPDVSPPSTSSQGSQPIDAVWASDSLLAASATWLSFDCSTGDHRAAVLDFRIDTLLGTPILRIQRPGGRHLNTSIPSALQRYRLLLTDHFVRHKLLDKLYAISTTAWENRSALLAALNHLDAQRCEGMRFAESRCRRLHMGGVSFSPQLNHLFKQRHLFRLLVKYRSGRRIRRRTILRLAAQCQIAHIFAYSQEGARQALQQVDQQYRKLKPQSAQLRSSFLMEILESGSANDTRIKAVRLLLHHEHLRHMFRFLKNLEGRTNGSSVSCVEEILPDQNRIYSTQQEIEECLSRTFSNRFRLAESSPFSTAPLEPLLGPFASNAAARSILQGQFLLSDVLDLPITSPLRSFIDHMQHPVPPLPTIPTTICMQAFNRYWRRAKETTSSSFSGLHFGHYKAAVDIPLLSEFHAYFTEITFRSGCSLSRWQQGLQVVLEKTPGVRLASKLRAILLMEADFNFGNKFYIGSRMIRNASVHDQILPELYGGVKGRRADHMALARVLLIDIMRQQRRPFAIASVDAQSCYDRIAHIPASLCCQRWGIPPNIMESMLSSIQRMRFHLRTAFGDSRSYYGGGSSRFQGVCQGNGAGPAVWLALSTCLVLGLYHRCTRPILRGVFSGLRFSLLAFLFVDDTDLFSIAPSVTSDPLSAISHLQSAVTSWQDLLQSSGGALSVDKCSWSLLAFRWKRGIWSLHSPTSLPGDLHLRAPNGSFVSIQRTHPSTATRVVGVHQALDGSMKGQLEALQLIVRRWSSALTQGSIPRHFAWAAFRSKIWPNLRYPLTCTTISRNQGKHLMGSLYRSLLPRLGANRSIPCAIRHGPSRLLGLNLPDPYIYQGSQQVSSFLQLFGSPTNEGSLLQISLEQLQLEVGISQPVLSSDFSLYGFLASPCWLTSLWAFLSRYKILLHSIYPLGVIQREQDQYLMDVFFAQECWTKLQLGLLNQWRIHQQLLLLSDVMTGDGLRVRGHILKGEGHQHPSHFSQSCSWPSQQSPPKSSFASIWRAALTSLLDYPNATSPLGLWTIPNDFSSWEWWHAPSTDQLFRFRFNMWMRYTMVPFRATRQRTTMGIPFTPSGAILPSDLPSPLLRATVYTTSSDRVLFEGSMGSSSHSSLPHTDLLSLIRSWDSGDQWPLRDSRFPSNGEIVASAIRNGNAHGVCDGSYMPNLTRSVAAAAWSMEDASQPGREMCTGATLLRGPARGINAYRAELQGIHALLLATSAIVEFHHITSGSLRIYCDNERAVTLASLRRPVLRDALFHSDLLRAISGLLRTIPVTVSFEHIRGHQDHGCPLELLTRPAQLNIGCDVVAKDYLTRSHLSPEALQIDRTRLKGEPSWCLLDGRKVTSDISKQVTDFCTEQMCRTYISLIDKGTITADSWPHINWEAIGCAMQGRSDAFRLWASKFAYDKSATALNMVRWGLWDSANCPCCGQPNETARHILLCEDARLNSTRHRKIEDLEIWLQTAETDPSITQCLIGGLRDGRGFLPHASAPKVVEAASAQDALGIPNTYIARLDKKWESLQGQYYLSISSRRSSSSWAAGLATQLLQLCHCLWVARNQVVHDQALRGANIHEHNQLAQVITEQFDLGDTDLLREDLHLVQRQPLSAILALPLVQRRIWVQSILWARSHGAQLRSAEATSMSAVVMRNWLHPPTS